MHPPLLVFAMEFYLLTHIAIAESDYPTPCARVIRAKDGTLVLPVFFSIAHTTVL